MKPLRFIVALVLFAAIGAAGWLFVVEPLRATQSLREIHSHSPELADAIAQRATELAAMQSALSDLRQHTTAVDTFDAWRHHEIEVLGQPTRPWEVARRRSELIATVDLGFNAIVALLADADQLLADLEASEANGHRFSQQWRAAQTGWVTRSELTQLHATAEAVQRDVARIHDRIAPSAEAVRGAIAAWDSADATLNDPAGPPVARAVSRLVRPALNTLRDGIGGPTRTFVEAADGLGADADRLSAIVEASAALTPLPRWLEPSRLPR